MSADKMLTVTFLPSGRSVQVIHGTILLDAAQKAGVHVNASCGGAGVCGKCRVHIDKGDVSGGKSEKLSEEELSSGIRQACTAMIETDITVSVPDTSDLASGVVNNIIPERHRATLKVFDIAELKEEGAFAVPVEKHEIELSPPSLHNNMADAGRLIQGLADQYGKRRMVVELQVLRKLGAALRECDFRATVTMSRPVRSRFRSRIINIQPGSMAHRNYGMAIDIGTTTVHGRLIDINTGDVLAEKGEYNKQMSYGEDVISRIIFSEREGGLEKMQELAVSTVNSIIRHLLEQAEVEKEEVNSITLAGNTTMSHLFLGIDASNIRRSPYVPVTTFFPPVRAKMDIGLDLSQHTVGLLFPSVSSYVGGDIVAGIMGSGMYRTDQKTLFIDVGTNAEIVIGNREWLACAACSAGPAFEGGGITHGIRASAGAIEDFSINPVTFEPMNSTISRRAPTGICGSGLLIIAARLFESGVIDQRGKFKRDLSTERIRKGPNGWEYVLAWADESAIEHDIVINEMDLDNFIRAKAAIYAGVSTLMESVGLKIQDIEQIILAGAFGSYIDIDAAMTVGLLPEIELESVKYVGNGSLMGCHMSELSNHIRQDVVEVVRRMTSFELSEVAVFKDHYMASMFMPHTDLSLFPRTAAKLSEKNIVTK